MLDLAPTRALVERHRPRCSRDGFPAHVRTTVVDVVRQALLEERSIAAIAYEVGVAQPTLRRWLGPEADQQHIPKADLAFLPVQVIGRAERARPSALTWIAPSGHRIDGLTLDDVVELLRRVA